MTSALSPANSRQQTPGEVGSGPTPTLLLDRVGHRYGATTALHDVSLSVEPGEVLALVGPSGCGKSTLLRIVAGLVAPSSGTLMINGADATKLRAERRGVGYVPQSYALFPHLSVRDNIGYGLAARRVPRPLRDERIARVLELTRMSSYAARAPSDLSGGQRQRVALARALVVEPSVLLLDEPLSALDPQLRDGMRRELRALLAAADCSTIIVTHDQSEALGLADRVAVMQDGRLIQTGTVDAVWNAPAHPFVAEFVAGAATFSAVSENGVIVLADDWRLPAADFAALGGAATVPGGPCFVVVRQIDGVTLREHPVPGDREAIVLDAEPRGSTWSLRVRLLVDGQNKPGQPELTVASPTAWLPGLRLGLALRAPGTTIHPSPTLNAAPAPAPAPSGMRAPTRRGRPT